MAIYIEGFRSPPPTPRPSHTYPPSLSLSVKDRRGAMVSSGLVKLAVCSRIVKVSRITDNPRRFMRIGKKSQKKRERS
ncbi:hypothetical protein PUN28_019250 [Cardiocondyla obscurior]|uniref:Uncharacterized protein n=1 Tax=Cardiocondyla obscurior TaxID=286306 RepID=A0AAW2EEI6_9HYME